MKRRAENFKESIVGWGMLAGALMMLASIPLLFMFGTASVYRSTYTRDPNTGAIGDAGFTSGIFLGLFLLFVGALVFIGSIGYGWFVVRNQHKGPTATYPRTKVISRFAIDHNGHMLTQDWEMDQPRLRHFVKLDVGGGEVLEFQCRYEVFSQAGEGMVGQASVQGKWLGAFVPAIGTAHYADPLDDRKIHGVQDVPPDLGR